MEWNEIFKLLGPLSKTINQIEKGYCIILKNRTIFQFKDFSMEVKSVNLYEDKIILLNDENVKLVPKKQWEELKFFTL